MKILALEFSGARRSVALRDDLGPLVDVHQEAGRHTRVFELIGRALAEVGWAPGIVDAVAVGIGPGSYTGIRLAIAVAQGWHLAHGVRLLGVNSVDCVAHQLHARGDRGPAYVAVDAQRGDFYLARYELRSHAPELTDPLRVVRPFELRELARAGANLVGPDLSHRVMGLKDGVPEAAQIAEWAAKYSQDVSAQALEPIYLRPTAFVKAPRPREGAALRLPGVDGPQTRG
jgi:tRNA threonylcarbamoyladenosine biosynthesis protein TsaB